VFALSCSCTESGDWRVKTYSCDVWMETELVRSNYNNIVLLRCCQGDERALVDNGINRITLSLTREYLNSLLYYRERLTLKTTPTMVV